MLFCQPLNDSSESLIDLLLLPASIALQIKNDVGQNAIEIGQNNTARSWILELSVGEHSCRPPDTRVQKKMMCRLAVLPEVLLTRTAYQQEEAVVLNTSLPVHEEAIQAVTTAKN